MNAALLTLLGLQLYSYLRFFLRSLRTLKGALLAGVGLLFLIPYVVALAFFPTGTQPVDPDWLRQNGPVFFLIWCLLQVLFSANQSALYFTPAEVQFLFSGPFTRRQILLYKITLVTLLTLPLPLFLSIFLRHHAGSWPAAVLSISLAILFVTLFTIAVNLVIDTVGAGFFNRARTFLGLGLLALVTLAITLGGGFSSWAELGERGVSLGQTPVVQAICWPLSWFFELFLAREGTDFLIALSMCMLVNVVALLVIFALDKNLLELAAANSERVYAMIQQVRRGGTALAAGGGGSTWAFPDFPYLAGIGPIFWRQLMLALRGFKRLLLILVMVGIFVTFGTLTRQEVPDSAEGMYASAISMMIMMTVFLTMLVPFDFRGDIDAVAVLKTMPISPYALAVGQLLTPTLITTLFHWGILAGMAVLSIQRGSPMSPVFLVALVLLFPVFNFLMFAVENLLFLIFPVRLMQATPGDFQSLGRNILLTLGKMFLLGLVIGIAAILAVVVYFASGQNLILALSTVWCVLVLAGLALIPPLVLAFANFDVGRDTPP